MNGSLVLLPANPIPMKQAQHIKLSPSDRAVLRTIEHRANHSFRDVSKLLRGRESQIRYRFHGLQKRGVILEKRPFVDVFALGFCYYKFYLTFSSEKRGASERAVTYLKQLPAVTWLAQVGGRYQLVFAICVRSPHDMYEFTERLSQHLSGAIRSMNLLIQVRFSAFGRKFLSPVGPTAAVFETGCHEARTVPIDSTDATILAALCTSDFRSETEVARALKLPLTTFRRRVAHLEETGVIKGYLYRYNLSVIGVNRFCLQLHVASGTSNVSDRIRKFSAQHPNVVNVIELIGPWQFEMTVDVERLHDVGEIIHELYEEFPGEILQVESVPVFRSYKFTSFSTQMGQVVTNPSR